MANESAAGFAFLYSFLHADNTLVGLVSGIFRDVAPVGTAPDWLVIGHQSTADTMTATGVRILTRNLYRVLAVGPEADAANLRAIADRIEALLMPGSPPTPIRNTTAGGVSVLAVYREQPLALSEIVPGAGPGAAWLNLGGLYRVEI